MLGVYVEKEWRYKKKRGDAQQRSLRASKSAFAYKVNKQRKGSNKKGSKASREVIIKFTQGAKTRSGIRGAIKYISRDYELELLDSDGLTHKCHKDIEDVIKTVQMNAYLPDKDIDLTKSLMFSPPRIAGISREDALESVMKTLTSMYPNNYFVMAYHKDTDNDHVHVVMNMNKSNGKRVRIDDKGYKEMRSKFAEHLIDYGYDVKATIKHKWSNLEYEELKQKKNRNEYEVVDFGMEKYSENSTGKSIYLVYKTNSGQEVKIWGRELEAEVSLNKVKVGDKIKLSKTGEVKVSVPVLDKQGGIAGWKDTHRNQWKIENLSLLIEQPQELKNEVKVEHLSEHQEIKLNSRERIKKHEAARKEFDHEKNMLEDEQYRRKYEEEQKLKIKQKHEFKF